MSDKKLKDEGLPDLEPTSNDTSENKAEKEPKKEPQPVDQQKKKYIFNCTKCGQCCENREFVPISLADIKIWTQSGVINAVFPQIKLQTFQSPDKNQFIALVIQGSEKGCPMYDKENHLCNIYHNLPLECKAFPLGYNGKNYYLKDNSVPGLGQGAMTKEQLIEDRDNARADFDARIETQMILPLLYSAFMQNLIEQQQKAMEDMPEDKRQQLEDLLKKKPETEKS
jgi:Fe-S-cluster containining protein